VTFKDPKWVSVRTWEVVYWRLAVLAFVIGFPSMAVRMIREGEAFPFAVFLFVGSPLMLRFARSVSFGIGFLPDRLLVSRALGLGREEIPLETVACCVAHSSFGYHYLHVYLRPRWRAPLILMSSRLGGIRPEEWQGVAEQLRQQFEPEGKWRRFPWWRTPSWL
jgi:hypothetical protein